MCIFLFTKEVKHLIFFSLAGHHHNCTSSAAGFLSKPARSMSLTLGVSRDSSCSSGVDSCRSESNNRQQHQQQLSYGGHQRFASGNAPGSDFRRTASGACLASASSSGGGSGSHSCFCHSPLHGSHHGGQVWPLNEYHPLSPLLPFLVAKN